MILEMIVNLYLIHLIEGRAPVVIAQDREVKVIASREMSLEYRYPSAYISDVFKDNILLNLAYLDGRVSNAKDINWDEVQRSFRSEFTLKPNETFAYHDAVLPEYEGKIVKTTDAHFNSQDGFKSDGYLFGDGVCHLASLLNWAARDANLEVKAPANHDFADIPEIPKEYGVAIYYNPNNKAVGARENLYITNNKNVPINFVFEYKDGKLTVSVITV